MSRGSSMRRRSGEFEPGTSFRSPGPSARRSKIDNTVPVQRPQADGVNYFYEYTDMPVAEFVERIQAGEDLYIGARQIMGRRGRRSDRDGLGELASELVLPPWLDRTRLQSANLWIGQGGNRTLLHYDPWDTFLTVASGVKEFVVLPPSETHNLAPFGALDYRALYLGKVLHSKIRPLDVQERYQAKFRGVEGFSGTISAGEVIHVPAGFWHYVESSGLNIGVNFFVHCKGRSLHFHEPLRTYWIKDKITLWPVRWFMAARFRAGRIYRYFRPRKTTA